MCGGDDGGCSIMKPATFQFLSIYDYAAGKLKVFRSIPRELIKIVLIITHFLFDFNSMSIPNRLLLLPSEILPIYAHSLPLSSILL